MSNILRNVPESREHAKGYQILSSVAGGELGPQKTSAKRRQSASSSEVFSIKFGWFLAWSIFKKGSRLKKTKANDHSLAPILPIS